MNFSKVAYACTVSSLLATSLLAAESNWIIAKTEHGYPDLQGNWSNVTATPFVRPVELGDQSAYTAEEAMAIEGEKKEIDRRNFLPSDVNRAAPPIGGLSLTATEIEFSDSFINLSRVNGEYRTSLIVDPADGRFPYVENGRNKDIYGQWRAQGFGNADGPEIRMIGERCITGNGTMPPMAVIGYNSNVQIIQTSDYVMIMGEMVNDARIIRLNSSHQPEQIRKWMGDSIAYYEEDTLVVHTQNYRAEQSNMRLISSEQLQVTERFTPISSKEIYYTYTVEDPVIYSQAITVELPLHRMATSDHLFEFACHEGNYSMFGILAGARRQEADNN